MCGRATVDEEPVALHELPEGVPDRVSGPPDPDGLHHAGVAQLTAAQLSVEQLKQTPFTFILQVILKFI